MELNQQELMKNEARSNLLYQLYLKMLSLPLEPFSTKVEDWRVSWDGFELKIYYKDNLGAVVSNKVQHLLNVNVNDPLLRNIIQKI